MKESILYCGQLEGGDYFDFYGHPTLVGMCGHDRIFKVRVEEAELIPDTRGLCNANPEGYFAWWDEEDQEFCHVGASLHLVEICFPYGTKAEADRGRGMCTG